MNFSQFFSPFAERARARAALVAALLPAERCSRCGHGAPVCVHCERLDPILGASIDGQRYCHTFSPAGRRSCYQQQLDQDERQRRSGS